MELYKNLGFENNPFSTFSAEEERSFLNKIYIKPLFYESLKSDLTNGHSRFVLGARGIGKTALLLQLRANLKNERVFSIILDDFEDIPKSNNETQFLRIKIEKIITYYAVILGKNPEKLNKLDKIDKQKLSFIIREFFKTLSKNEYEGLYNKADKYKQRNLFRNCWNYIFNRPINFLLSGGIEIASDTVRKSLGLPLGDKTDFYKNYIPQLEIETIKREKNPEAFLNNYKELKGILSDLTEIINKSGFKGTVVFFDKIDEYTKLNNTISAVSNFLENILKDTTILMNSSYALVFSLWDVLKPELTNKGVRFDKIKPIDITWQTENLKRILDRRISYFSSNKNKSINDIIENEERIDEIISLSNNSPRYLFRQLSYIYDQQAEIDPNSKQLSSRAVNKGQLLYAKSFDYYSIYPTKRGSKEDILKNINRILKIGKIIIITNDYVDIYKVHTNTAISYIKIVQEYNLVKELPERNENGAKMYEIIDPVLNYLIKNGVTELKK